VDPDAAAAAAWRRHHNNSVHGRGGPVPVCVLVSVPVSVSGPAAAPAYDVDCFASPRLLFAPFWPANSRNNSAWPTQHRHNTILAILAILAILLAAAGPLFITPLPLSSPRCPFIAFLQNIYIAIYIARCKGKSKDYVKHI